METTIKPIELTGIVGQIRTSIFGQKKLTQFSLYTSQIVDGALHDKWHTISYWCDMNDTSLNLNKGNSVKLVGTEKYTTYIDIAGYEHKVPIITATKIRVI